MRSFIRGPVMLALMLAAIGCGPSYVKLTGKVTSGGKPFVGSKKERVVVVLEAISDGGEVINTYGADVNQATGTFKVNGLPRKGLPVGRYRFIVQLVTGLKARDLLDDKFGPGVSKIIREVKSQGQEIDIDVDKPEG